MKGHRPKEIKARDVRIWHWKQAVRANRLLAVAEKRGDKAQIERWQKCWVVHCQCSLQMRNLPGLSKTSVQTDIELLEKRNARRS